MAMEFEYIIGQLRKRRGDDYILSMFPEDTKRIRNNSLYNFPTDLLLALMLSFIELSDVKSVSLVCKKWNRAFALPTFWKRHIEKKLELHLDSRKWLCSFDNFYLHTHETLRQQTEWLFMKGGKSFEIFTTVHDKLGIKRYSTQETCVCWTPATHIYSYQECIFFYKEGYRMVRYIPFAAPSIKLTVCTVVSCVTQIKLNVAVPSTRHAKYTNGLRRPY